MNVNKDKALSIYIKMEINDLKKYSLFLKIKKLTFKNKYSLECEEYTQKKKKAENVYISIAVYDENNKLIEIFDDGFLAASTLIIARDKKERFKFFSWEDDSDFIESLERIYKKLCEIKKE